MQTQETELWLDILGNPHRRKILQLLSVRPMYPQELSRKIGITPRAVQKHLKLLKDEEIIEDQKISRKEGGKQFVYYTISKKPLVSYYISNPAFSNISFVENEESDAKEWKTIPISESEESITFESPKIDIEKLKYGFDIISKTSKELAHLEKKRLELLNTQEKELKKILNADIFPQKLSMLLSLFQYLVVKFGTSSSWSLSDIMKFLLVDYDSAKSIIDLFEKEMEIITYEAESSDNRFPKWKLEK